MKIKGSSLDDIMLQVFERLLKSGRVASPTKGAMHEHSGVILELTNPRARLSRTEARSLLFGCLGELLWYLSGDDSHAFIKYYLPEYKADSEGEERVRAAYGPRLRSPADDKLTWVISLLKQKPDSRRAVISIYRREDMVTNLPEVPCTCTLQFLLRGNRLELLTHMRSNDAFVGLPGDIFAFTMIQELVARSLDAELGTYKHMVGSLHLYAKHKRRAEKYIAEGWQHKASMPPMPRGNQLKNLDVLLDFEATLRMGVKEPPLPSLPYYWQDIAQLLRIHRASKNDGSSRAIHRLRKDMFSSVFEPYIDTKHQRAKQKEETIDVPEQLLLQETDDGGHNENRR